MVSPPRVRCAIYTRKSSEEGLEQAFNSLDAQREASEAYIFSQRHEGWIVITTRYDDGGFSGGNLQRPALKRLLTDIEAKLIDTVIVYKVDRLTRSLADFSKLVEQFDKQSVGFLAVSQPFNTTTSIGRLTLNVLLSFAEFERDVTGERIRDKIAASKSKGMWMGGGVPLGYEASGRSLVVNPEEAALVQEIFRLFLALKSINDLRRQLRQAGHRTKKRLSSNGEMRGDKPFRNGTLSWILNNRIYIGEILHRDQCYPGLHCAIIERKAWVAVQTILAETRKEFRGPAHAKEQYLLRGLLFDRDGNRFTPTFTKKRGNIYRYYVNKVHSSDQGAKECRPVRLPVSKIEGLILSELTLLCGPVNGC